MGHKDFSLCSFTLQFSVPLIASDRLVALIWNVFRNSAYTSSMNSPYPRECMSIPQRPHDQKHQRAFWNIYCWLPQRKTNSVKMYLMYYLDENKKRIYTLSKVDPTGRPTFSAHPGLLLHIRNFVWSDFYWSKIYSPSFFTARFSPEDRYAEQRVLIKKRYGLLLTQKMQKLAST